jgi:peptide/nickel transport system ATP-binding protein
MQQGQIVETGTCDEIFSRPRHPYTQALLAASPVPDPDEQAERRQSRLRLSA